MLQSVNFINMLTQFSPYFADNLNKVMNPRFNLRLVKCCGKKSTSECLR